MATHQLSQPWPPYFRPIHINSSLNTRDTPLFSLRRWAIYRMANLQPLSPTVPGFCLTPIALLSHRMVQPLGCHLQNWCSCADSEGAMGFTLSLSLSLLCLSPEFLNSCLYSVSLPNSLTPSLTSANIKLLPQTSRCWSKFAVDTTSFHAIPFDNE